MHTAKELNSLPESVHPDIYNLGVCNEKATFRYIVYY